MALNYVRITKARVFILLLLTCLMMLLMTSSRTLSTSYLTMACQRMTSLSVTPASTQHDGDKEETGKKIATGLSDSASTGADAIIETEDKVARRISKHVRVLVWVMTSNKSRDRAKTVKNTWGQRVHPDILLFVSSVHDPSLPTIALNVSEGRGHLTAKTMQAFDYVYEHYLEKADFFMKVDDDTYVIMENLRYFLSHQDPNRPFVTGRLFKNLVKQGPNAINEYPITFHYIKPDDMKLLDFFLYRIRPYGISHKYT